MYGHSVARTDERTKYSLEFLSRQKKKNYIVTAINALLTIKAPKIIRLLLTLAGDVREVQPRGGRHHSQALPPPAETQVQQAHKRADTAAYKKKHRTKQSRNIVIVTTQTRT